MHLYITVKNKSNKVHFDYLTNEEYTELLKQMQRPHISFIHVRSIWYPISQILLIEFQEENLYNKPRKPSGD